MKRFLLPALVLSLAFLPGPSRSEKGAPVNVPAKPITVPFELLKSGHMAVQVKVNGKGPYRLVFDTGAPITLVNNKVARESGMLKDMPKPAFTLFGSMGEARIKSLEVGGAKAEGVAAVVMDHPTVKLLASKVGALEGIVGFPFFARFAMTVDYQARTLTFVPNGYDPPDVMKGMMKAVLAMRAGGQTKVLAPPAQWGIVASKDRGEEPGVTIKEVVPGSAAALGGLRKGDRLLTLDGRWTDTLPDLFRAAGYVKPGTATTVKVKRGGKEIELEIKPAAGL